jgi:GT2 family glycosyltransferase
LSRTTYDNCEILLLVNESDLRRPERAVFLSKAVIDGMRVLTYPDQPFNYARVNNWGVKQASGDLLCFLNDDVELMSPDWLGHMVARILCDGVGAVGSMMFYPDGTIQHAGVILGLGGVAGHACLHERKGSLGYFGRACLEQDVSCVTAACMVIRPQIFGALGGFDESLPVAYNDVDLCIKLRRAGWRIIWTPLVELIHHESASFGRHDSETRRREHLRDVEELRRRWGAILDGDPFYNRNLSLERQYELAFPPR